MTPLKIGKTKNLVFYSKNYSHPRPSQGLQRLLNDWNSKWDYSKCHNSSALHAQSQRDKRTRRSKCAQRWLANERFCEWTSSALCMQSTRSVRSAVPKNFGKYCITWDQTIHSPSNGVLRSCYVIKVVSWVGHHHLPMLLSPKIHLFPV